MTIPLSDLIKPATETEIYDAALAVAVALGLPVTSWTAGDPTRSLYHIEAETLAALEQIAVGFIRSGFLDYAADAAREDDAARVWLRVLAQQVFGVDVPPAVAATCDVALTNTGGGVYDIDPGDLTLKSTTTGKTYRNTTGGHLPAKVGAVNGVLTVSVVADEAGSASSAAAGEIDAMVTSLLGVTCSNALAAVGVDEQDPSTTVLQCRDKLGSLSPDGPREAYTYVARNPALTGTTACTRARAYGDGSTGNVSVYLAAASGGVPGPDVALITTAILKWATPLCITPTVASAVAVAVPVTYEVWIYKSVNRTVTEIKAAISAALTAVLATRQIGGDIIPPAATGKLYRTLIESTIRGVYPQAFRVALSAPAADVALGLGDVATLGAVVGTVNLVSDP